MNLVLEKFNQYVPTMEELISTLVGLTAKVFSSYLLENAEVDKVAIVKMKKIWYAVLMDKPIEIIVMPDATELESTTWELAEENVLNVTTTFMSLFAEKTKDGTKMNASPDVTIC